MNEVFKIILSLSLSGTLLFVIILAFKPLYKNRLSKGWQYYLWLIVIARMLMPFTTTPTLVGSMFEYFDNIHIEIRHTPPAGDAQPDSAAEHNGVVPNARPKQPEPVPHTPTPSSFQAVFSSLDKTLWILWAAIAFALLIRKITMYQSFVRFVRAGREEVSDIRILNLLAYEGENMGIKKPVELFVNPLISTPMLLGFVRPYIILPGTDFKGNELAYIMRHELTHYKHLDMFYKWLVQITVCLHWFNPFVYLMAKEINRCCELSCDESMIKTLDRDGKREYGDTLLNSLKATGHYNDKLATVTLTEGAEQLKERLDGIMRFKKTSKTRAAIMLVTTLVLALGATAMGAYAAGPISAGSSSSKSAPLAALGSQSANAPGQLSISTSGTLPDQTKDLALSCSIEKGGVEILPAASNEIKASYDSDYYNVDIAHNNGIWNIKISGKLAKMGMTNDVQLYIPDIKCTMDVTVLDGSFTYALPDQCENEISITAKNSGIDFISKNQYKNSAISLTAANTEFLKYEPPVYPDYFTKTGSGLEYTNGTGVNKINITLTGYTSVNFAEMPHSTRGGTDNASTSKSEANTSMGTGDENSGNSGSSGQRAAQAEDTGSAVLELESRGQNSITQSGSFEANDNQILTLTIHSDIKNGSVDLILFSPDKKEQRITFGGSDETKTIALSQGRWAYNCTGFFKGGDISITGKVK